MGLDAEEGLAHDDKRRDVEDEVRRQIMEIQAVLEHEPPDKGVKWKAQSAEEVGKKNDPLMGPGGGDELSLVGQPMRNVAGQVAGGVVPLVGGGEHPAGRSGWVLSRPGDRHRQREEGRCCFTPGRSSAATMRCTS